MLFNPKYLTESNINTLDLVINFYQNSFFDSSIYGLLSPVYGEIYTAFRAGAGFYSMDDSAYNSLVNAVREVYSIDVFYLDSTKRNELAELIEKLTEAKTS